MTEIEFLSEPVVSLEDFMGGDDSVAMSAWVSFGNDDAERLKNRGRVEGLINFLYRNQHMTPFESTVFTFRVETPLFVRSEIMRHRSSSFNEYSGRYSEMLPKFYVPTNDRPLQQVGKPGAYTFVEGTYEQRMVTQGEHRRMAEEAWKSYQKQLKLGIAKEVARDVLPLSMYTRFYFTLNARNLMHFLSLRTAPDALYEIRQVAGKMEEHLAQKMPLTYKAYNGT